MNVRTLLFYIIVAAIPAYFINKWMIRVTKPRESFRGLFLYIFISLGIAMAYTALFVFIMLTINPLPKK